MGERIVTLLVPNKYDDLWKEFLLGLDAYPAGMEYEIIRLDGSGANFKFSRVMNKGLKQVKTKYTCMMNDDVYPKTDNWLKILVDGIDKYDFAMTNPISILERTYTGDIEYSMHSIYRATQPKAYVISRHGSPFGSHLSGGCLVCKTKEVLEIGGFDEDFEHYYEDVDLCYRMEDHLGKPNGIITSAIVHHPDRTTTIRVGQDKVDKRAENSLKTFIKKWGFDPNKD